MSFVRAGRTFVLFCGVRCKSFFAYGMTPIVCAALCLTGCSGESFEGFLVFQPNDDSDATGKPPPLGEEPDTTPPERDASTEVSRPEVPTGGAGGAAGTGGAGGTGGSGTSGAGGTDATNGGAGMLAGDGSTGASPIDGGSTDVRDDPPSEAGSGCPPAISFSRPAATGRHGWTGGGEVVYTDICPAGQVVVGYVLYEDADLPPPIIGQMETICGLVSVDPSTCQIRVSPAARLPLRGQYSDRPPVTQTCPADQMIVAFRGRSGSEVYQVGFGCAPLALSRSGSTYRTTVGAITWFLPVGGMDGTPFQDGCSADQVAIGSDFYSDNNYVDAFGLYCSAPTVAP